MNDFRERFGLDYLAQPEESMTMSEVRSFIESWTLATPETYAQGTPRERSLYQLWTTLKQKIEGAPTLRQATPGDAAEEVATEHLIGRGLAQVGDIVYVPAEVIEARADSTVRIVRMTRRGFTRTPKGYEFVEPIPMHVAVFREEVFQDVPQSGRAGTSKEGDEPDWKASFERIGRVLNCEAREHGEIIAALGIEYDSASMESDETFHSRVLQRVAELTPTLRQAGAEPVAVPSSAPTPQTDPEDRDRGTDFPRLKGKCPACGNTTLFRGSQGYITCSWLKCSNPGAVHDLLMGASASVVVPAAREEHALEALAFAEGAIIDAIGLEDGLDGSAGEAVLKMIRAALIANGKQPITIPPEDEPGDPPYQTTAERLMSRAAVPAARGLGGHLEACWWDVIKQRYECAEGCEIARINASLPAPAATPTPESREEFERDRMGQTGEDNAKARRAASSASQTADTSKP